jgi:hypothetical protein
MHDAHQIALVISLVSCAHYQKYFNMTTITEKTTEPLQLVKQLFDDPDGK